MKQKGLAIVIGGIILISAAFLGLNFRAAFSNTQVNKLVSTTNMGDNMPESMKQYNKISLAMIGEGPLANALIKSLKEKIGDAGIGEIELGQEGLAMYQNPVLIVRVGEPNPIWTPFFATGQLSVHAGYASNGDTTFFEPVETTHTTIGKPNVVNMYAEYDVNDRTFGLVSRPGYHQYLADTIAQEIATVVKEMYKR